MARVLHIGASPRADSYSLKLATAFLEAYRLKHPQNGLETLNVFDDVMPEFAAPAAAAKYAVLGGQEPEDKDQKVWAEVIAVIRRFMSADLYVFSSPMWNFSIPYRLKKYIDVIVQPGLTFKHTAEKGYEGLVTGRPAVLMLARGGTYYPNTAMAAYDMQRPYLETILKFIGFTDIRVLTVEGTLEAPDKAKLQLQSQMDKARKLAETL